MKELIITTTGKLAPHITQYRIELIQFAIVIALSFWIKKQLDKKKYKKIQSKLSELALSKSKDSSPEFDIHKNRIRLYNLSAKTTDDIISKNLEPISNIFNRKLTSFKKGYMGFFIKEIYYDLYENQLKDIVEPIYTNSERMIIGEDQFKNNVELNRKADFLIGIFAATGSGKSVVVSNITSSFIRRDLNKRKRIIFLDYKGLDSTVLIKKLNASHLKTEIVFFDMSTSEGLKEANHYIKKELIEKFNKSKRLIAKHSDKILYTEYEREREENENLPPIPFLTDTLLICDELLQYINPFSGDNEEDKKNKSELAESIAIIQNTFRVSGQVTVFTSQEAAKDQLKKFRVTNLKVRIFGNLNSDELESKYGVKEINKSIGLKEGRLVIQSDHYNNVLFKASFSEKFYDFLDNYKIKYKIINKNAPSKESLRATHKVFAVESKGKRYEVLIGNNFTEIETRKKIVQEIRRDILKDE